MRLVRSNSVQSSDEKPRNLSRHQYAMLKYLAHNKTTLGYLRHFHANTLGSIAHWKWIAVAGNTDDSLVEVTAAGYVELDAYDKASFNERASEGGLTERCQRLLKYARRSRVVPMTRTA